MNAVRAFLRRWWPAIVISVVVGGLVGGAAHWAYGTVEDRNQRGEALVETNSRIEECTTPGLPCFEESQRRQRQTLASAFGEIDCILRRALAGLPAFDPRSGSCAGQTPADVYPGGA